MREIGEQLLQVDSGGYGLTLTLLRTILIYVAALAMIRLDRRPFLGKATPFDILVAIMLGSLMSRAIDGSSPLVPTFLAGSVLLGIHWLFAWLAYHTSWFGSLVKGNRLLLIKDGKVQHDGMRKGSITHDDLMQALRIQARQTDPTMVKRAYLERSGQISIVLAKEEPRVFTVSVKDGVQTIRIELD